jgi:hypothetical protein
MQVPHVAPGLGLGTALEAGTVALLYLLGWRARDRAAGVIAGLLAATSLPFAHHAAAAPLDAAFALLAVASLFSFVAGSSLVALAFAGLAAAVRPDGLLLGGVLLGLALAQRRRRAGLGALAFVLLAGIGWAVRSVRGHTLVPPLIVGAHLWLVVWAATGGMAFVTWLLLPFLGELGEAPRRARWLPVALWTFTYLAVESFVRVAGREATVFGLLPLWCALAGAGLSRLLPALTGDVPLPWARYGLAALAVLSLVAMRGRAEWPRPHPMPHTPPTYAMAPTARPAPPPAPAKPVPTVKPAAAPVPAVAATAATAHHAPAPKAAVQATPKPAAKAAPKAPAVVHPSYRPRGYFRYHRPLYRRRFVRRYRR